MKNIKTKIYFTVMLLFLAGCAGSKFGYKKDGEVTAIKVHVGDPINKDALALQTNTEDGLRTRGGAFFDPTALASSALDLVISGVKTAIEVEKQKYQASYNFILSSDDGRHLHNDSMYFYSKMSKNGLFDAQDMQFTGFSIARIFNEAGSPKVAMEAVFQLDTSNLVEIVNDGIFRLKLKDIVFNYAKAKIPVNKKTIDLDIEVEVFASYLTKEGVMNSNALVGKFETNLNNIALQDPTSWKKFANTKMQGWSFVVPRSYCRTASGKDQWNQGSFKIHVSVKEISTPKRIQKLMLDNGSNWITKTREFIDQKGLLESVINNQPPTNNNNSDKKPVKDGE